MHSSQPNAAQKRWREFVRGLGSRVSRGASAVIHHPVGRKGKHNKVDIGHWWVVPLTDSEHKDLHNGETFGYGSRKLFEKRAFKDVLGFARAHSEELPPPEVISAIESYHR